MRSFKCLHLLLQALLLVLLMLAMMLVDVASALDFKYHDQEEIEKLMERWSYKFPHLTNVYSIGKSVRGADLWVITIGRNPSQHSLLVPNVKYIANMHGNEVVGRELLLQLAEHLLLQYGRNQTLTDYMDTTKIHIMPTMNPDGFATAREGDCDSVLGRHNALGYDLNRNFPDVSATESDPEQKETQLIRNWIHSVHFVLSANLHGGALVVNYPFDSFPGDTLRRYSATPDDDVFRHLSLIYSRSHPTMISGESCGDTFKDGITNGANWYPVTGGMQDYMYRNASGYEVLVEVSCCKYPKEWQLEDYWELNKNALINLMFAVHMGVKGLILGQSEHNATEFLPLEGAEIAVSERESIKFWSTRYGEYFKLLLPGTYVLQVHYPGFLDTELTFLVQKSAVTRLDVKLFSKYSTRAVPDLNETHPPPPPPPPPPQLEHTDDTKTNSSFRNTAVISRSSSSAAVLLSLIYFIFIIFQ